MTLHIRCGSDLKALLPAVGLDGDYYEHSYPYLIGPVREGEGALEQRARFLTDSNELDYETTLARLHRDEQTLLESVAVDHAVIWSEGDVYDQLVLVRLLAHYARYGTPRRLELINAPIFGRELRTVWASRTLATDAQLALGLEAWKALIDPDPRALAAIARTGTLALPLLAPALLRHLGELPSATNGLGLTEELALTLLAERPRTLNEIFLRLNEGFDPLPGQGDFQVRDRVLAMESTRVFTRQVGGHRSPWTDVLTITDLGREVLAGAVDFRSLDPPSRWVGGVHVGDDTDWRWNSIELNVVRL
ncbi:MAG: hypothetical protein ABW136_02370 [Steroidobacteraceae bacterium]